MEIKGKSLDEIQVGDEISISKKVPMDEGVRYAEASGDWNPLHQDDDFARAVGFNGKIVHGLYMYAFCGKLFTDLVKDPMRLKRLKVRFSDPLYPGDTVTVKANAAKIKGDTIYFDFEVKNQEGSKVITKGGAEVSLK